MVGLLTISVLPAACSLDLITSMSSTFVASGTFVPKTKASSLYLLRIQHSAREIMHSPLKLR